MYDAECIVNNPRYEWVVFIHGFGGSCSTWQKQKDEYSKGFNLLLLSMHAPSGSQDKLTVEDVCRGIAATMSFYGIHRAHIISLSFGSMLALAFGALYRHRVISMVMAGGIIGFDFRTNLLLFIARALKDIVPYIWLYGFFALCILPKKNHAFSRAIFVREAKKLGHGEFCRWLRLIPEVKRNAAFIDMLSSRPLPILYVMGKEDHLFLPVTLRLAPKLYARVHVIQGCGHVCSIEKAEEFNDVSRAFLTSISTSYTS